ncbi:MAG: hypothetical protein K6G26_06755 [Lachnospiraceae bacterium]|nr:hypothetical protein [Lachnospiraceae bacterium]
MDKRIVIVTMASVMLLAGCTVEKKDNVQETGVELGSEVVENSESADVNEDGVTEDKNEDKTENNAESSVQKVSNIEVVEGKYNNDNLGDKYDWGYDKILFGKDNDCHYEVNGNNMSVNCEETGIYKYDYKKVEEQQKKDQDLDYKYNVGTITDEESFIYTHYGSELLVEDKNCTNLTVYEDVMYYVNSEGKAYSYDFKTKKKEIIEQLKEFNIQFINVANNKSIYFVSDGMEYQYIMGDTKVTKVKKAPDNFIGCCQTKYGILYLLKSGDNVSDFYINDIKIIEGNDGIDGEGCGIMDGQIFYYKMDSKTRNYDRYTIDINQLKDAKGIIEGTVEK